MSNWMWYACGLLTGPVLFGLWVATIWVSVCIDHSGWVFRLSIPDDEDPDLWHFDTKWKRDNIGPFWMGDRTWGHGDNTHVSAWMAVGHMGGRGLYIAHGKRL